MNILVTGSAGFAGRNLVENLKNIRDGKNKTRPAISIDNIYEYDKNNTLEELDGFCRNCDLVFNLAGVNRPKDTKEFREVNFGFAEILLDTLKKHGNTCPVMLSSSIQATLAGRFGTSEYGLSKRDGEELFFRYAEETGAKVYVYRFPNLVGKWIRPNYNSAVGTFCNNIANDLPITVNDPSVVLEMLFIDDLIEEMYDAAEGHPHRADYPAAGENGFDGLTPLPCENGRYCYAPVTYKASLGEIVELLHTFRDQPKSLVMPSIPDGSFAKKLYSMYLSYLPKEKVAFDLKMNCDDRGSFTELLKTADHGQFSVNISEPGITKGQHWHNSKWEFFIVVSGHALIQERRIGSDEILEFEVSGDRIQAVHMLPGYTHNIINLSDTEKLVTVMWANEQFDPKRPDTFFEKV
ncbi:MAG: NAD-dependent epimerase/dehydratase family protein [Ruminococcus sp.]|uniref:polysaccharide biosynthesis C-terminal domain-containing protein n=1 Tax=Ruminococcus sp. TaxID=41978 RepID=UPI0025DE9F82|nr:NAD-dependent epimerase/dehydratase family protein [Ruminococcus sp.]MCR5600132.1 NAD-dependent epimerase/dehydratase family protein [Ruminococcus sp.]